MKTGTVEYLNKLCYKIDVYTWQYGIKGQMELKEASVFSKGNHTSKVAFLWDFWMRSSANISLNSCSKAASTTLSFLTSLINDAQTLGTNLHVLSTINRISLCGGWMFIPLQKSSNLVLALPCFKKVLSSKGVTTWSVAGELSVVLTLNVSNRYLKGIPTSE